MPERATVYRWAHWRFLTCSGLSKPEPPLETCFCERMGGRPWTSPAKDFPGTTTREVKNSRIWPVQLHNLTSFNRLHEWVSPRNPKCFQRTGSLKWPRSGQCRTETCRFQQRQLPSTRLVKPATSPAFVVPTEPFSGAAGTLGRRRWKDCPRCRTSECLKSRALFPLQEAAEKNNKTRVRRIKVDTFRASMPCCQPGTQVSARGPGKN